MQVVVTGRHMSVSEAMKSYAQEKVQKFLRHVNRISEIRVVLDLEAGKPVAECIVDVERAGDFVARETNLDMYAAIDAVVAKMERQLIKHKELVVQRHKKRETEKGEQA